MPQNSPGLSDAATRRRAEATGRDDQMFWRNTHGPERCGRDRTTDNHTTHRYELAARTPGAGLRAPQDHAAPRPIRPAGSVAPMSTRTGTQGTPPARWLLLPLALAQFICSFAGSNMNVMLNDMSQRPRHHGPGHPALDHPLPAGHGGADDPLRQADRAARRKTCLRCSGSRSTGSAPSSAPLSPGTRACSSSETRSWRARGPRFSSHPSTSWSRCTGPGCRERARAFGIVSAAGGIGAATGPLIGGWITATIQLARGVRLPGAHHRDHPDPRAAPEGSASPANPGSPFDVIGAVLSATRPDRLRDRHPRRRQQPAALARFDGRPERP